MRVPVLEETIQSIEDRMNNPIVEEYRLTLRKKRLYLLVKRIFDITLSVIMLVVLAPLFLMIGIWIKLDSSGSVFYRQERVTKNGEIFKIFKFRTMVQNADTIGTLVTVSQDARITKAGHFLRKYRLDEIPQLLNVFCGDMSFVGARPEVWKYVQAYSDEMLVTLLLPAGVTSMASIMYKDEETLLDKAEDVDSVYIHDILPDKMKYNIEYTMEINLLSDIFILLKTVSAIFL